MQKVDISVQTTKVTMVIQLLLYFDVVSAFGMKIVYVVFGSLYKSYSF